MILSRNIKVVSRAILSSDRWLFIALRQIIAKILLGLAIIARPVNLTTSNFFNIYRSVFEFNPDQLAAQINPKFSNLKQSLVYASRAFFEIAFARGELLRIYNLLQQITTIFPDLFIPWKLLHYCCFHTKSQKLLSDVNKMYEQYRRDKIKSLGISGFDVNFGDHVTSSIGHSQIFFDFQILNSRSLTRRPKIGICRSNRDRMSSFYRELMPDLISGVVSVELSSGQRPDLVNFVQDSFPFMVTKEYFGYQEERGRAKYLASWVISGGRPFMLAPTQKCELDLFLRNFGLRGDDWYVVLHVREGFDNSIRNADINTYYGAIEAITSNGGWVFRIGDTSMTPLRQGMPRVIDLPFSEISKPNFLDLYLLATARFVICTASGPSDFPFYFNVPRLVTNWHIMSALFGTSHDICVPVSYFNELDKSAVSLEEQLTLDVYNTEPGLNNLNSVTPLKNSSQQIQLATIQMIEFIAQNDLRDHFPSSTVNSLHLRYCNQFWFMGSIAKSFLEDNPNYLD
jgi:putative glycosyltransferase (TIGR04372 family)